MECAKLNSIGKSRRQPWIFLVVTINLMLTTSNALINEDTTETNITTIATEWPTQTSNTNSMDEIQLSTESTTLTVDLSPEDTNATTIEYNKRDDYEDESLTITELGEVEEQTNDETSTGANDIREQEDTQRNSRVREKFRYQTPISVGITRDTSAYRYPKPEFKQPPYQTANLPSFGSAIRGNLTKVQHLSADCYSNYMRVTLRFNGSFNGLIYSTGYALDTDCVYVNGTGASSYQFFIRLNRCGTLGQEAQKTATAQYRGYSASITKYGIPGETAMQTNNQFMFNTLTVQFNKLIEEEEDEQIRVSCEYGNDYWKTVNFPVVNVDSFLQFSKRINTGQPAMAFTLTPPQCTMEIRKGYGTTGTRIAGPVTVGDPLTLMIHMKSVTVGFDIVVSNCVAHNGGQKKLQLIDANGCVLSEKLISRFRGFNSVETEEERVTLYAFLKAFRFTGSPALYLECDVRMCHGTCPPQRCYWRSLTKRSADESERNDTAMSESVSLTQALNVRHESMNEALVALQGSSEGTICLRQTTFSAMITISVCLIALLSLATLWFSKTLRSSNDDKLFSPQATRKMSIQ